MSISKKAIAFVFAGIVLSFVVTTAIRFVAYHPDKVHYHANFALYIDDKRDLFAGPGFYEEIQACTSSNHDDPRTRVHLHDNNPGLVHVHDHGVIWGDLFANLGYGLTDKAIVTPDGVFADGQDGNTLTFILNGKQVDTITDKIIGSEDKLLINYGTDDKSTILKHVDSIPSDAHKANTTNDPSTCKGSEPDSFGTKLKAALWR